MFPLQQNTHFDSGTQFLLLLLLFLFWENWGVSFEATPGDIQEVDTLFPAPDKSGGSSRVLLGPCDTRGKASSFRGAEDLWPHPLINSR